MFFLIYKKSFLLSVCLLMGHSIFQSNRRPYLVGKVVEQMGLYFQNSVKFSNLKKNPTKPENQGADLFYFLC